MSRSSRGLRCKETSNGRWRVTFHKGAEEMDLLSTEPFAQLRPAAWRKELIMNLFSRLRPLFILGVVTLAAASPIRAVDGVIEINQASAEAGSIVPGDAPGFPVTINGAGPRSFRLTSDLVIPDENTSGITLGRQYVEIDLNGFTIQGPVTCFWDGGVTLPVTCSASGTGVGVDMSVYSRLHSGQIIGMGSHGIDTGSRGTITDVTVQMCAGDGITDSNGGFASVRNVLIEEVGGDGAAVGRRRWTGSVGNGVSDPQGRKLRLERDGRLASVSAPAPEGTD